VVGRNPLKVLHRPVLLLLLLLLLRWWRIGKHFPKHWKSTRVLGKREVFHLFYLFKKKII